MTEKDYPDYPAGLHVRRETGEPGTVVEQQSEMITVEWESGGKSTVHWHRVIGLPPWPAKG